MFFYISVFGILLILATIEVMLRNKKISFITGGLLAIIAGFRFYTGYDFNSYGKFYSEVENISDVFNGSIEAESGFLFLNFLFKSMGFNYHTFILFFALFSLLLLTNFVYKFTSFPSLVLLYYYARYFLVRDMGQIRSAMACIILLYSIPYVLNKKPFQFLVIVFVASLFHITAWSFIIVYIFHYLFKHLTVKNITCLLGISFLIGVIVQIPSIYIWAIPERYNAYFTSPSYTNGQWILNPILWMQLMLFFTALILSYPKLNEEKNKFNIILKIYFLASLILIFSGTLSTVGGRLGTLFATSEIFIVPIIFSSFTKNKLVNMLLFSGFTFAVFCLIFIISETYIDYMPYETIFNF
ncbi:EpsG family protein [Desemzia sp. FAM 23991]|uniref:EpsG family protein n=1 Tax=unclassified Desemzia TaxID=2685243 RepID=UPI0038893622